MKLGKNQADVDCRVEKVYLNNENKRGGSELRLVTWIINGKPRHPRLERRVYFYKGEEMTKWIGKAKGFDLTDMKLIRENMDDIIARMEKIEHGKKDEAEHDRIEDEEIPAWQD